MKQRVIRLMVLGVALCAAWPVIAAGTAAETALQAGTATQAETAMTAETALQAPTSAPAATVLPATPVMKAATMPKYLAAKGEGGAMFGFALSAYPRIVIEQNGPQSTFKVIGEDRSIGGVVTLSFSEDPINSLKPAIVERSEDVRAEKFLRDGVLYIRKGDRVYNLQGILQND